jgi:enoyl-CoA hydratase/carnithine racemase
MEFETLVIKKEEPIMTVMMNRPETRNALNLTMNKELEKVVEEFRDDERVKVMILTGAGESFCSGMDFHQDCPHWSAEAYTEWQRHLIRFVINAKTTPKPIISAVNGAAIGGGLDVALGGGDIIIASEKAVFAQTFVRVGVPSDSGAAWFLPRLVGVCRSCELLFTGKRIDAKEAERIGLINRVVAHGRLESEAREIALQVTEMAPLGVGWTKLNIYRGLDMDLLSFLDFEVRAHVLCAIATEDGKEGGKAFLEKRVPRFAGK